MTNKKKCFSLLFFMSFGLMVFAQPIKTKQLLKKTEQSLNKINTVTYKIDEKDKSFTSKEERKRTAVVTLYREPKDKLGVYYQMHIKNPKNYCFYKYNGAFLESLYYKSDSLDYKKKIGIQAVKPEKYLYVDGESFALRKYFTKNNIFKYYQSIFTKFVLKKTTTEEGVYKGTPVYIFTVYGKDKPRSNRVNSAVEKHYIRKSDFLPIAYSFYGEFQGMKEKNFVEIDYLEINPKISLDTFKIDQTVKEVVPRAFYEEVQKYNL